MHNVLYLKGEIPTDRNNSLSSWNKSLVVQWWCIQLEIGIIQVKKCLSMKRRTEFYNKFYTLWLEHFEDLLTIYRQANIQNPSFF